MSKDTNKKHELDKFLDYLWKQILAKDPNLAPSAYNTVVKEYGRILTELEKKEPPSESLKKYDIEEAKKKLGLFKDPNLENNLKNNEEENIKEVQGREHNSVDSK